MYTEAIIASSRTLAFKRFESLLVILCYLLFEKGTLNLKQLIFLFKSKLFQDLMTQKERTVEEVASEKQGKYHQ